LADPGGCEGFEVLEDLRAQGDTEYLAHLVSFGGVSQAPTALYGVALSVCTDAPGGLGAETACLLEDLAPLLGLAAYRIALLTVTTDVLGAYVGRDAGRRVLMGEMRRGQGHVLPAALMIADLRGFTSVAETEGEGLISRLGEHLAAMTEPVEAAGGEVLKFMGDGLLAAFPAGEGSSPDAACRAALRAARDALARNAAVDARHPGSALPLDVALHLGDVFYGNIGAGSRLDFTVIGPAVNEVARIETLCGALDRPLLMSAPLAACCGEEVVSLGRHLLRGVAEPREIFAPAR
jgi:adenylate cyclase